jgi:hypothetical protein
MQNKTNQIIIILLTIGLIASIIISPSYGRRSLISEIRDNVVVYCENSGYCELYLNETDDLIQLQMSVEATTQLCGEPVHFENPFQFED